MSFVEASGSFSSLEELENLTVVSQLFRLRLRMGYCVRQKSDEGQEYCNGIAISTVSDGNVVIFSGRPFGLA